MMEKYDQHSMHSEQSVFGVLEFNEWLPGRFMKRLHLAPHHPSALLAELTRGSTLIW